MPVRKKKCSIYAENIRRSRIKFSRLGDQACWICKPLDLADQIRTRRFYVTLFFLSIVIPTEWLVCTLDWTKVLLLHRPTCLHKVSELRHIHFG